MLRMQIAGAAIILATFFSANASLAEEPIWSGKEDSGGGGGIVIGSKRQSENKVKAFLSFLKDGDNEIVARFFYGPYSQILKKLPFTVQPLTSDTLKTLLNLGENILSPRHRNFLSTFVSILIQPDKSIRESSLDSVAFFPDIFSFIENFDRQRLTKSLNETELIFTNCALRHNLPKHKLASYFFNRRTGRGELCFDSESLTKLGPAAVELQIAALFVHELVHMYFDKAIEHKMESQESEESAKAMQEEFFDYYASADKFGFRSKAIQNVLSQILRESAIACGESSDVFQPLKLHSSFIKTQMLTHLLDSYFVPISAYLSPESAEFEVLQIAQFLNHFRLFSSKQSPARIEKLKKFYCEKDPQSSDGINFNSYLAKFLKGKLERLEVLDAHLENEP